MPAALQKAIMNNHHISAGETRQLNDLVDRVIKDIGALDIHHGLETAT